MDIFLLIAHLVQYGTNASEGRVRMHMENLASREKQRISQFLQKIWDYRDLVLARIPTRLEPELGNRLTDAIMVCILELEGLYHNQNQ